MPKLTVDGIEVEVAPGSTVFQACQAAGIEVPHFCFHERLAIAGNCRMYLVEQEKAPKPIASCAMPAADNMVIHTNSEKAKKARKGDMEIGTYVERTLTSELSGNIIDLCPVGALTAKPHAFVIRPWELRKTESVDVLDAVGSNIRVDSRGPQVLRVLPRLNEDVNEEWISDKTRFAVDGLAKRRLDRPYVRRDGRLVEADWPEAFRLIASKLKGVPGERIAAVAGDIADVESMLALKELMASLGAASIDCRQDGAKLDPSSRAGYLFNATIAGIEQADACLLI